MSRTAGIDYGRRFVAQGLDSGIGEKVELTAYLRSGAEGSPYYDKVLHSFVACGNYAVGSGDAQYWWYRVLSCAENHHQGNGSSVPACAQSVPQSASAGAAKIRECMANPTLSSRLMKRMHEIADKVDDYPTVLVNNASDPRVPEPDTHGDDPSALIKEICRLSAPPLPKACASA